MIFEIIELEIKTYYEKLEKVKWKTLKEVEGAN